MPKFFIDPPTAPGEDSIGAQVTIDGEDAYHLTRVLRVKPGEKVTATDGQGHLYELALTTVTPEAVHGEVIAVTADHSEPEIKITLCQSILKGEKMDWVLQKGTEIGVSAFVPFLSARTVARPTPPQFGKKQERWQKIVTAAAKQSGPGIIPAVQPILAGEQLSALFASSVTLVAWEGETIRSLRQVLAGREQPKEVVLIIGPEGGFAPEEVEMFTNQGALSISLGSRILRAETAGPLAAALLLYHYDALEPTSSTFSKNGR